MKRNAPRQANTLLPKWMMGCMSAKMNSLSVALAFALSLNHHGTPDQLRGLCNRLRDKVYLEHRPKMKRMAAIEDDEHLIKSAQHLVENVTDALNICPGQPFPVKNRPFPEITQPQP